MIQLTIPGEPVPQARPRLTKTGNAYTPEKSRRYKKYIRLLASAKMVGKTPLEGPLCLSVRVYRSAPKSGGRKWHAEAKTGLRRPVTKPDLDNYVKAVQDGLNGIVWHDDSQIVTYGAPFGKFYDDGGGPRVEVMVWELTPGLADVDDASGEA